MSFSGGLVSALASERLVQRYGKENVINLFADTLIEDADLYRFNTEFSEYLGVPLTRIADGRTPWQVFREEHILGNTHSDICSRILKRELIWSWINGQFFCFGSNSASVYLGMDFTEYNRLDVVRLNNPDWFIDAPMCWEPVLDRCQMLARLKEIGIAPPKLYGLGFPHNNCGGFCVKAGISHFIHLYRVLPDVYRQHEEEELFTQQWLKDRGVKNWQFAILRDRRGGITKPMTLRTLRERIEANDPDLPKDEWGGCGCAVDYDRKAA